MNDPEAPQAAEPEHALGPVVTPRFAIWVAGLGGADRPAALRFLSWLFWPIAFILKWPLLGLIVLYKRVLSPVLPPACRFEPSCSIYVYQAITQLGLLKGLLLGALRLLRCQPLCQPGYDPVPDPRCDADRSHQS